MDTRLFNDFAPRGLIRQFTPFQATRNRLPKSGGTPALQQQKFLQFGMNHDQYRFRSSKDW